MQSFYLCNVVPRELRQHWKGFFLVQCCLKPEQQHYTGLFLCNVVPRVLTQHWTWLFPVQCCLKSLGQHYTRFFHVQCYPSSIKITLHRIIFRAMLSQASWATLHKVFTCAMLSQEYWDNIKQDFFLCIVWSFKESTT